MRKPVWRLKQLIIALVVAQLVMAIGIICVWVVGNKQDKELQRQFNERVLAEDIRNTLVMQHIRSSLVSMGLIKQRQDKMNELIEKSIDKTEEIAKPAPVPNKQFKPPFKGRPN